MRTQKGQRPERWCGFSDGLGGGSVSALKRGDGTVAASPFLHVDKPLAEMGSADRQLLVCADRKCGLCSACLGCAWCRVLVSALHGLIVEAGWDLVGF